MDPHSRPNIIPNNSLSKGALFKFYGFEAGVSLSAACKSGVTPAHKTAGEDHTGCSSTSRRSGSSLGDIWEKGVIGARSKIRQKTIQKQPLREREKQLHVRAENRTISLQSSLFDPG